MSPTKRYRLSAILSYIVVLAAGLALLDMIVGAPLEREFLASLQRDPELSWADRRFAGRSDETGIAKKGEKTRILYLSNSHALTGGRVSNHLQKLSDRLCPNQMQVIDLSSAGMFAPEYLQRFAAALDYDLSAVVLPLSYISFSDRMPLRRQALSARSMFKAEVLPRLPLGFWLRNWDIGVYSDAAVSQLLRVYRYRNDLRDRWERPLSNGLRRLFPVPAIRFLEVDERKGWRFPDGFDSNLFNWKLYHKDRDRHVADMSSLIALAREEGVRIIASNLPIHWRKERRPIDQDDLSNYRSTVRRLFVGAADYVDYQDGFPKEFTTYDALHPTWHGARLHAFDLALRLRESGVLPCPSTNEEILEAFLESDSALSEDFVAALRGAKADLGRAGLRRFDFTEPSNVEALLGRALAEPVFSPATRRFLVQLSVRLRYWKESEFEPSAGSEWSEGVRKEAFAAEKKRARIRIGRFVDALARELSPGLAPFPLPDVAEARLVDEKTAISSGGREILTRNFLAPGGNELFVSSDVESDRLFSVIVRDITRGTTYERVDVLGDGSFLELHLSPQTVHIPNWISQKEPVVEFGT
jgi:hypothetical protein